MAMDADADAMAVVEQAGEWDKDTRKDPAELGAREEGGRNRIEAI